MDPIVTKSIQNFQVLSYLDKYIVDNSFIAGGCFKNILNKEPLKDIDLFFNSEDDYLKGVSIYTKSKEYELCYETNNVIAFKDVKSNLVIELIKKTHGTTDEVLNSFDFTITKFAIERKNEVITIKHHKDFFEHLHMKRLVIDNKLLFPISTFERSYKYKGYGYGLCRESKMKLIEGIRAAETVDDEDLAKSLYFGID